MDHQKELTRAEEQIMQVIWDKNECFVKDILELLPEPKPAYNTVSTIVRILENKGFVGHQAFGKSHQYHALVERESYRRMLASKMVGSYFNGSIKSLVSFFVQNEKIDLKEADEIIHMLQNTKKK